MYDRTKQKQMDVRKSTVNNLKKCELLKRHMRIHELYVLFVMTEPISGTELEQPA